MTPDPVRIVYPEARTGDDVETVFRYSRDGQVRLDTALIVA